jgi:KaiC/GvpD/RAD55 family RecA-like ATPase
MTAAIGLDIQEMRRRLGNRQIECVVVDSLNAVEGDIQRDEFFVLNAHCASSSSLSLFVDEEHADHNRNALREYVSDIVVRLGCRDRTETEEYIERYIEIVKARNQFHYRGKHPFSIVDPARKVAHAGIPETQGGVCIYPSMAARLRHQSTIRKAGERDGKEIRRVKFDIGSLDVLLFSGGKTKTEDGRTEGKEGGVARESTTLIIGERGTKKTMLGFHFLATGVRNGEKGLLISLKDDNSAIRAMASEYSVPSCYFSEVQVEPIRPSYIAPGHFLDQINTWLEVSERAGEKVKRVLFDNFAQIRVRFPLLNAEPMFIPTLIDLFKNKGITTLFIDIVEEPGKAVWEYKSPILDLADYVIATQHLEFLGKDHIVISVRRSLEGKHDAEPAELRRDENRIVVDNHAFDGITGVLEKDPKPAEIFVRLFHENIPERRFNEEIKEQFAEKYDKKVHVSSFSRGDSAREYGRIKRYWIESPSSIVKVVSLDEYWVKYAAHREMLWEIDEKWFAEEEDRDWLRMDVGDFLSGALNPAKVNGSLYAIPNHVDLGLFCYRKDLFKDVFEGMGTVPSNLCKLLELVLTKRKDIRKRKLWGFGFDMESEETLVCTFLEFLFNTGATGGKVGERFYRARCEEEHKPIILCAGEVRNAAVQALETMRSLVHYDVMPFPCTLDDCERAVVSRHWYSTLSYVYCDLWHSSYKEGKVPRRKRAYRSAKLEIVPVSTGDEADDNNGVAQYSCSGSWYLGILKQSLRPRLGYHLIDEMTSVCKNFRRYEVGAGLPARKSFYRFHGGKNVKFAGGMTYAEIEDCIDGKEGCRRKVCRRESICGNDVRLYRSIRSNLAEMILDAIGGRTSPKNAVGGMLDAISR